MIDLLSGHAAIQIDELAQWRTYAGMLAGLPSARRNTERIEAALERANAMHPGICKTLLIEPIRCQYPSCVRCAERALDCDHEKPERLPPITSVVHLISDPLPTAEEQGDGSCLTVVCFNNKFGFSVDWRIQTIDWSAHASNWLF